MHPSTDHHHDVRHPRARLRRWIVGIGGMVIASALAVSCDTETNLPTQPADGGTTSSTTSTTTTTAAPTTTTTAMGTTTTTSGGTTTTSTTTTTTTTGSVDYASEVHPIWSGEGCTMCHNASHVLNLTGSAVETCEGIEARDGDNGNLVIVGGQAGSSELIRKPQGDLPHAGGAFPCFQSGAACFETVLAWASAGAIGPGGDTCGS